MEEKLRKDEVEGQKQRQKLIYCGITLDTDMILDNSKTTKNMHKNTQK